MKQNWERKHIADICEKASSNIAQNKLEGVDGEYPVYGASGFVQNVDFYQRDTEYIGIVKDGSGVGRVNTYPAYSSLLGTMQYILPKKGYLLQFVSYALKSLNLASFASGAAIPHIYFKDYGKCEISVPPLMEQSRIVAELDLLTGIIDKQKAQLKELDNLAQSIFYDMFGDPIENPKGWNVQLLKQHTTKIGSGATPKGGNESYKSEGIPLIRSLNVYNGTFKYKDLAHIDDEQAAALDNVILLSGDVLLNITGASVARCCIVPSDLVSGRVNQHVAILRPKDSLKSVFLCAQLISSGYQRKLLHDSKANGATREALTKSQLEGLPVIIPPLKLQQEFADKITAIASQKSAINLSMAETQKLLDYTMDKYFG